MKAYKRLTVFAGVLTGFTFVGAILTYYVWTNDFWFNICLALFGSAALALLTSVVTYHHERIKTMEGFLSHTRQILAIINRYQEHMTLEEKMRFFLDYHDFDVFMWDTEFGNMDFFFERCHKNREYIYNKIYSPIAQFGNAVNKHVWHFRWYFDGTGKNDAAMRRCVTELEDYLIRKEETDVPTGYDENGTVTSVCHQTIIEPRLVLDVKKELAGHYYDIMYGKRSAARIDKEAAS